MHCEIGARQCWQRQGISRYSLENGSSSYKAFPRSMAAPMRNLLGWKCRRANSKRKGRIVHCTCKELLSMLFIDFWGSGETWGSILIERFGTLSTSWQFLWPGAPSLEQTRWIWMHWDCKLNQIFRSLVPIEIVTEVVCRATGVESWWRMQLAQPIAWRSRSNWKRSNSISCHTCILCPRIQHSCTRSGSGIPGLPIWLGLSTNLPSWGPRTNP